MTTYLDVILAHWMGEIGDDQKEVEFEPLTAPAVPEPIRAPTPEKVPA